MINKRAYLSIIPSQQIKLMRQVMIANVKMNTGGLHPRIIGIAGIIDICELSSEKVKVSP